MNDRYPVRRGHRIRLTGLSAPLIEEPTITDSRSDDRIRRPPPVRPGDRVGVAALSGPVEAEALDRGIAALEGLGFEVRSAPNLRDREGLFAGTDRARLDGFHELVADPSVRAVFFARGGHGVLRLLPDLDWELLARTPRAYVGYSDLTPFLLEVVRRLGWIAFHGPMVATDLARGLEEAEARALLACLSGECRVDLPVRWLGPAGEGVEGVLWGGCLSLLVSTLGTPWAQSMQDKILFVEDVGEPLYRIDRMLTQLRLSRTLRGVRALAAGRFTYPDGASADVADLFRETASSLGVPAVEGIPAGHGAPHWTLPLGAWARLSGVGEGGRLSLELPEEIA